MKYIRTENFTLKKVLDTAVCIPSGQQIFNNNILINLNDSSLFILEQLSTPKSENEITEKLLEEYETDAKTAAGDVSAAIKRMLELGLICEHKEI